MAEQCTGRGVRRGRVRRRAARRPGRRGGAARRRQRVRRGGRRGARRDGAAAAEVRPRRRPGRDRRRAGRRRTRSAARHRRRARRPRRRRPRRRWSDAGPASVGPPAAPAGYPALAERGRLPLERLAAPAIELADGRASRGRRSTRLTAGQRDLLARDEPRRHACTTRTASRSRRGRSCACPGLAAALASWSTSATGCSTGRSATRSSPRCSARGGVLDARRPRAAARRVDAVRRRSRVAGRTVWATPAPTHGPSLLDAVVDAQRPATTRRRSTGACWRRSPPRRDTLADPSGTSMVSAADRERQRRRRRPLQLVSRASAAGSSCPSTTSCSPTGPAAGSPRRPATPTSPPPGAGRRRRCTPGWLATPTAAPRFVGGTPGGDNQMPWNAQLLQGVVDGETARACS